MILKDHSVMIAAHQESGLQKSRTPARHSRKGGNPSSNCKKNICGNFVRKKKIPALNNVQGREDYRFLKVK
jgi:hypothetical protein